MYNTSKIIKLKGQAQLEIDEVLKKYEPLINASIKNQIPKSNNLFHGMGTTFCENKKGEYVGIKFTNEINNLAYSNSFKTGININEVINIKL